jgi:hypothetical protein
MKTWAVSIFIFENCDHSYTSVFKIFYSFIHMCIHCLGHFSLLPLPPPFPLHNLHFLAEPVLPLSLILLKRTNNNKIDKGVLLVEKRIAIQRDS